MATATTTAQLIREDRRDIIKTIQSTEHAHVGFAEHTEPDDFREWAEANPQACLRRFQIRDLGTYEPPVVSDMVSEDVATQFTVTFAYPVDNRYGDDVSSSLDDAIRSDMVRVETMLGALSFGDYPSGLELFTLDGFESERGPAVHFEVATFNCAFRRAVDFAVIAVVLVERVTEAGVVRITEAGDTRVLDS